jgi:hypothetical protein
MKLRHIIAAHGIAFIAILAFATAPAASAAPSDATTPPAVQSCLVGADNGVIYLKSCNWHVTVERIGGCRNGHFQIWNRFNPNQYRNSWHDFWCPPWVGGGIWDAGEPWSNETCATFWYLRNGVWTSDGPPICNHDA